MSFLDELNNPNSQKIVLYEYDIGEAVELPTNYDPGIFVYYFDKSANATSSDLWPRSYYYENEDTTSYNNIKSLKVDNENYILTASIAAMRAQEKSFYFDKTNQKLYVHFDDDHWYLSRIVRVGAVNGVVDNIDYTTINQAFYEDIFYEPDFLSLPSFSRKKDPLFFGKLNFLTFSVNLQNTNGFYDDFTDKDVYGQRSQIFLGFAGLDYSEYISLATNYIEEPSWDFNSITIKNQDERDLLSRKLPIRRYTKDDFSGLSDDNDGKYKPLCWGPARNAPTVCLDETTAVTNATFSFVDTFDHAAVSLGNVYAFYQDNKANVTGSVTNIDLTAGTFQLPVNVAFDSGTLKEITCDFVGYSIDDGFDVIADVYNIYADIPFNATNYNLSEWNAEKTRSKDIGLYIKESTEIQKIFSEIALSLNAVWFVQEDGLITMRVFYEDRIPKRTIDNVDWLDDPSFSKPVSEFLSSVTCQYDKNQNTTEGYRTYLNTNYENQAIRKYKRSRTKSYPTLLTNENDAIDFTEKIVRRTYDVLETVKRKTKLQHYDLQIMDFIIASHHRQSGTPVYNIYEIIGKTINLSNMEIEWTLKKIKYYTMPIYQQGSSYGDWFGDWYGVTDYV